MKRTRTSSGGGLTLVRKVSRKSTGSSAKYRKPTRFSYASLYRNMSNREYQFVDRAEFLIGLADGGTGNYGPWSAAPGSFVITPAGGGTHNGFSIYVTLEEVIFGSTANAAVGYNFLNYTDYSNLFDEYRIDEVVFDMKYNANSYPQSTTVAAPGAPIIYMAIDYDDATLPTTNTLLQYASCKPIQFGNSSGTNNGTQWYKHVPAVNLATATISGTQIATIKKHQWINTDQPGVQHFGVKGWYDNPYWGVGTAGANIQGYISVTVKIKFSCRITK